MSTHEHGYGESREPAKAADLRRRFDWLSRFTDGELREISFCFDGEPLKSGEQYFDISHPEKGVLVGQANETVPEGSCYVARSSVKTSIWNKLTSEFRH